METPSRELTYAQAIQEALAIGREILPAFR